MYCPNCGIKNEPDARFCLNCGAQLSTPQETPEKYSQTYQAEPLKPQPMQQPGPVPKKKRKGLVIGIISGIVVLLAAAAAVYFIFLAGTPVTGEWYSEEQGMAISFDGKGIVENIGLVGTYKGGYVFDKGKGEGTITIDNSEERFTVKGDELTIQTPEKDIVFLRASEKFDAEEFIEECFCGSWSNEELVQVIEIKKRGAVVMYSASGEVESEYKYAVGDGEGTITFGEQELNFVITDQGMEVLDVGIFTKQDDDFEIYDFIEENAVGVVGIWYITGGEDVTLEFSEGHSFICTVTNGGVTNKTFSIYDFDEETGEGTLVLQYTVKFYLKDGKLYVGEDVFIRHK